MLVKYFITDTAPALSRSFYLETEPHEMPKLTLNLQYGPNSPSTGNPPVSAS